MKKLPYLFLFLLIVIAHTSAHAYWGVKIGGFHSNGETSWGGGLVYGIPVPAVKGLAIEIEESGYYNGGNVVDLTFLQTSAGPVLDFNPWITPDSNFFHPYIRGGVAYAFLFSNNDKVIDDQNGAGFFTGAGITLNFKVISLGVEANYNYINFDTADNDYWNYFFSGGIHF